MKLEIKVLGTGEAFPDSGANTSFGLRLCSPARDFVIDCGYASAQAVFEWTRVGEDRFAGFLFTHLHADHCWGSVPVVVRAMEEGRKAPLQFFGPKGTRQVIERLLDLGYPGVRAHLGFSIEFTELTPGQAWPNQGQKPNPFRLVTAPTQHSVVNLMLRIEAAGRAIVVSGDGRLLPHAVPLIAGADLWFQECFTEKPKFPWHQDSQGIGAALEALDELAQHDSRVTQPRKLILTHRSRTESAKLTATLRKFGAAWGKAGDRFGLKARPSRKRR